MFEGIDFKKWNTKTKVIVSLGVLLFAFLCIALKVYVDFRNEVFVGDVRQMEDGHWVEIDIHEGATEAEILDALIRQGLVDKPLIYRIYSRLKGYDSGYVAGIHTVKMGMPYKDILESLTSTNVKNTNRRFTIPEGYTIKQIADKLSREGFIDRDKFIKLLAEEVFDYPFLEEVNRIRLAGVKSNLSGGEDGSGEKSKSYGAESTGESNLQGSDSIRTEGFVDWPEIPPENMMEGFLFPDTYEVGPGDDEKSIIIKMLDRFDEIFSEIYYNEENKADLTPWETVILASLIEKEAQAAEDRPVISSVFHNRLKSIEYPRLESCASIQYILGYNKPVLSIEDTRIESPYNTYIHPGLPPAAIGNPGRASLEAALNPADTDYLFFVARRDGGHIFSRTYEEHLEAVDMVENN